MDDALGGATLLPAVREDLRLVVAMLSNAAYTEAVGTRLHAVAVELGRLAGWLAFDSAQPALAQRYFLAAVRAAHVSGDRAIGANILSCMSVQARYSTTPADAVTLIESALRAERELTPAVAGLLCGRLAVATARTGDATASQRAQDRAFDLLGQSVADNEPAWIYWFTEAEAWGMAGESLLVLGRPGEAESHLRRAVGLLGPGFSRDRAHWLCELASARLGMGSVEHACATATEAAVLIHRLSSPHCQRMLADFRVAATPYARSAAVREFDTKHRALLGPTST
jgi:hypothetical protein